VSVLAVLGLLTGLGYWMDSRSREPPFEWPALRPDCTVEAGGRVVLDLGQMANAATITAVGVRLGMPERAVVVALATAFQESKLRNLPHLGEHNDHDSVGLFQQRPSQGWGSVEQVADPRYSSERFYRALGGVEGWSKMRVTDAAQRVQRSAFPDAYQEWADDATVLATALLGHRPGAVACSVTDEPPVRGEAAAAALSEELARDWGEHLLAAEGDPAGQLRLVGADEPPGLTVTAGDPPAGWRYAHWLVSHAAAHGVTRVQFEDLEWTAARGTWSPAGSTIAHVHAEVERT
jgi:hypothetical protein